MRRSIAVLALVTLPGLLLAQRADPRPPERRTLSFHGVEREYFVYLPPGFDRNKSYWLLVTVHGRGGNGSASFLATEASRAVADLRFDAIVVSPSFPNDDDNASRFPVLREGEFLEAIVKALRADYSVKPKILLTGYSRGGQFAHRFALANPEQVEAVAPFAAGTWTTPDGRLLVEDFGEVRDPRTFLSNAENASAVPARLRDLFEPRVAAVAGSKAAPGSQRIPFLVMSGTLDPRLPTAKEFVRSLEALGYRVEVEWPRTPHTCPDAACRAEYAGEFRKYPRSAVEFFQRVSEKK